MYSKTKQICQKTTIIPIVEKIVKNEIENQYNKNNQYSLKNNLFDPTKNSPPNDFMIKLYNRVSIYDSYSLRVVQH
uniref:Uncharacterized protein n=1 Tax=viral metagenome TaxID=1070528 RepID=A0A6C0DIK5_9ZZZZ